MANMSYCRFENTRNDMMDCISSLRDEGSLQGYVNENQPSREEKYAIKKMYEVAKELMEAMEDIENIDWDED